MTMKTIVVRNVPDEDYDCFCEAADEARLLVGDYFGQLIHEWVQPEAIAERKLHAQTRLKLEALA